MKYDTCQSEANITFHSSVKCSIEQKKTLLDYFYNVINKYEYTYTILSCGAECVPWKPICSIQNHFYEGNKNISNYINFINHFTAHFSGNYKAWWLKDTKVRQISLTLLTTIKTAKCISSLPQDTFL